jgi:hypothetical protein
MVPDGMAAMRWEMLQWVWHFGTLVLFVAEWTGVIFLRRSAARIPWALMVTGVAVSTLITAASLLNFMLSWLPFRLSEAYQWIGLGHHFGNVIFAIGFALHGMQASRASNRARELEEVAAAMSEEMSRMNDERTTR